MVLKTLALLAPLITVTWKPVLLPSFQWLVSWPLDEMMGPLPTLSQPELVDYYQNKKILVVGGTRGIGYGTALALAKAGAHITLVGRHVRTEPVFQLKAVAPQQRIRYLKGDIGSVQGALQVVETLTKQEEHYDFLVVSAGIFPDWGSLKNEDGLEKSFAVGVVGRFLLYRHMHQFLTPSARVLNILGSGMEFPFSLDRELALGKKDPTSFFQAMVNMNTAHELMLIGLEQSCPFTIVSTHPGVVATELHQGQGIVIDTLMHVAEMLLAVSKEECGIQHANLLASDRLHEGQLSYVDAFSVGRKRSTRLQKQADQHLDWLWQFLVDLNPSSSRIERTTTEEQ